MRELKVLVGMCLVAVALAGLTRAVAPAGPARQPSDADLDEMTSIRPVSGKEGLYVIPGFDGATTGGNVAVRVTAEGVILVDNKYVHSFERIMKEVRKVTDLPVEYVLDTHHHFDHSGSNADFMVDGDVLSHRNARDNILRNEQTGAPRLVFDDSASVFLGGIEARAHPFGRGHTNGDAVIFFPDLRTVHTGDLFLWGHRSDGSVLTPFMDYENGGSGLEWTATLDRLLELDFDTAIPGHGPVVTKAEVRTFRDSMRTLEGRMRAAVDAGVGRDDVADHVDTEDLNWPLRPEALQAFWDEVSTVGR